MLPHLHVRLLNQDLTRLDAQLLHVGLPGVSVAYKFQRTFSDAAQTIVWWGSGARYQSADQARG